VPAPIVAPDRSSEAVGTIEIDAELTSPAWDAAGLYVFEGKPFAEYRWLYGQDRIQIRVDYATEVLGDDAAGFDLYVGVSGMGGGRGMTVGATTLGFDATHLLSWRGTQPIEVRGPILLPPLETGNGLVDAGMLEEPDALAAGFDGTRIEFSMPLASLGPIEGGDPVAFRLVDRAGGPESTMEPASGPGAMVVPDREGSP
jgi:hypothetical protein